MVRKRKESTRPRLALVIAAFPKRASALRAARALVREGTLACATVAGAATAVYRWEGKFVQEPSAVLWGKTTASGARRAVAAIRAVHPDRVPEILVLKVAVALPAYAAWVASSTRGAR